MSQHCLLFNVTEHSYLPRSAGVHRIATWLRQHDFDVEVIDWANHWTLDELQYLFKTRYTTNTKFVGFSHLFSIWNETLEEFCSWLKINYPELPIISGSAVNPVFVSKYIDYYIQGFGEYALLALLKWLISNGPRPRFDLKKINNRHVLKANDTYVSFPMKSLLIRYEDRDFIQPDEWLGIETARGCKFQCKFCNFPVLGVKGDYSRDADDFEYQLRDTYDRFGVTNYTITDETFNDRTEKITKFADVVYRLNFQPYFAAYIRADLMISRPQDREELLRMNVQGHFYGVESFNTQSARAVGKGMDGQRLQQGLLDCKQYFQQHSRDDVYRASLGLIIGLPYETIESLELTRQWLISNWQKQSYVVSTLNIPRDELSKPSQLSVDYAKYGYTELVDQPPILNKTNKQAKDSAYLGTSLIWKNENMDIYQARAITDSWVSLKDQHDFRRDPFSLGQQLKTHYSVQQRIQLTDTEFLKERKSDVQDYITAKLNWTLQ